MAESERVTSVKMHRRTNDKLGWAKWMDDEAGRRDDQTIAADAKYNMGYYQRHTIKDILPNTIHTIK